MKRDLEIAQIEYGWQIPSLNKEAAISSDSDLDQDSGEKIILEEYTFAVDKMPDVSNITNWIKENLFPDNYNYWKNKLENDLVILNDDDFVDFVTLSTEVVARTRIDNETKVVKDSALWYEENVPAESLFYSLVMTTDILKTEDNLSINNSKQVIQFFQEGLAPLFQLGGNKTIGRGLIRTHITGKGLSGE